MRQWIDGGAEWGAELADADAPSIPERVVDFAREVRPILSENCFTCHGPDEAARQRGLRLDVADGPFADRGARSAALSSFPATRTTACCSTGSQPQKTGCGCPTASASNTPVMPGTAEDALSPGEIETLRLWIDQGAEWQSHWAFVPPERPALPPVADREWGRNPNRFGSFSPTWKARD